MVGADVGGQAELVTPECGVLIGRGEEAEEARHYADILAQLLSDPERRKTLGQHARRRIEDHFRLEHMTDRFLAAYQAARQEREITTRPVPGIGLGRACASQAVEYQRLSHLTDWLWQERGQAATGLAPAYAHSWRTGLYFALRRALLPAYSALLKRNPALLPLKNRLKRRLLRGGSA